MKCESCGNELTGGAIICRVCNHNNALRIKQSRLQPQRASRPQEPLPRRAADARPNPSRSASLMTELPKIVPRKDDDANLIRFPAASPKQPANSQPAPKPQPAMRTQAAVESEADVAAYPPWRAQLREKVRQAREKRNTGELVAPAILSGPDDDADLDRNPIVESALKRIRWADHTPTVPPTSNGRQGARAAALAKLAEPEPEVEVKVKPEPRPQPVAEPRHDSRVFAPKPTNNVAAPATNRQPVDQVETRTLTPKVTQPTAKKPEPKSSPSFDSKILTPRPTPQTTTESRTETRYGRRQTEPPVIKRAPEVPPIKPDKHVETQIIEISMAPEVMPFPETEPASLWTRTLAGACDFEIIATAYLPLFGAYATLDTSLGRESFFIMLALLSTVTFVYQTVMLMVAGRTSGMALLNLDLLNTDDDSLPVTRRQKLLRAWAATIAFLCPPLNLLVTKSNAFERSLPDLISGTTVAKR
ncbi:MAG: RDD family protein [Acidobacteria bacterium]|nr:RDD family protein [Acidobacteriota bacterium]